MTLQRDYAPIDPLGWRRPTRSVSSANLRNLRNLRMAIPTVLGARVLTSTEASFKTQSRIGVIGVIGR